MPLESFGRIFPPAAAAMQPDEALGILRSGAARPGSLLAHGYGRSYGDTCLNAAGALVPMRAFRGIDRFDPATGIMEARAGTSLAEMIAEAAPAGFFPPVVPGTRLVTLGGAIANDIHGKNHHRRGTFGRHVLWFDLLRSDGRTLRCSADSHPHLFAATIGGMGLTGLILRGAVRLMRVPSLDVRERVTPFRDLAEYFDLAEAADRQHEYAVAWVDALARGRQAGRGLLFAADHAPYGARSAASADTRLAVPFQPPVSLLNRPSLTVFNALYRWRKRTPPAVTPHRSFFFPLDRVRDWNRLYGPAGLFQHQSVVPNERAAEVLPAMLRAARDAGQHSFLTVLKRFGSMRSPGLLSFPRPGYTLTLDFPNKGPSTLALLDRLDRLVVEAGGAVNPYKDAHMPPEVFAASFPGWRRFEALRDPAFASDFWRRTALRLGAEQAEAAE